jgi:hypothetical protein
MNGRTALGAGFVLLAVLAGALFLDRPAAGSGVRGRP